MFLSLSYYVTKQQVFWLQFTSRLLQGIFVAGAFSQGQSLIHMDIYNNNILKQRDIFEAFD